MSNALVEVTRGRTGAIRQADTAQVFANAPLRYADGDAVGDLILGGSDRVSRAFVRRLHRRICRARRTAPVILDADLLDPALGIAGPDRRVRCGEPATPAVDDDGTGSRTGGER